MIMPILLLVCLCYAAFLFLYSFSLYHRKTPECGPWVDIILVGLFKSCIIVVYSRYVCLTVSELFLYLLLTIS